jgi:hypothetical protein
LDDVGAGTGLAPIGFSQFSGKEIPMLFRLASLLCLAMGLFLVSTARAEEKAEQDRHEGKIVKIAGNKVTMSDKEGKNEQTHTLAPDGKVFLDGKEVKLEDLRPGTKVIVTTKKGDATIALRIDGTTK